MRSPLIDVKSRHASSMLLTCKRNPSRVLREASLAIDDPLDRRHWACEGVTSISQIPFEGLSSRGNRCLSVIAVSRNARRNLVDEKSASCVYSANYYTYSDI